MQHCRSPHIEHEKIMGSCGGPGCLFDLSKDESESNNLINDTTYAAVVKQLTARLLEAGATGPPWAFPIPKGAVFALLNSEICAQEQATGYFGPVRTTCPPLPPTPPPPPPVWQPCIKAMEKHCPYAKPPNYPACVKCGSNVCNRTVTVDKYCHRAPPASGTLPL